MDEGRQTYADWEHVEDDHKNEEDRNPHSVIDTLANFPL